MEVPVTVQDEFMQNQKKASDWSDVFERKWLWCMHAPRVLRACISRAWLWLNVIASNSDWLIVFFTPAVIGHKSCLGSRFISSI